MAKICDRCGRSALRGYSRSHSNVATIRRQHLNLQSRRIDGVRQRVCVRCIKARPQKAART